MAESRSLYLEKSKRKQQQQKVTVKYEKNCKNRNIAYNPFFLSSLPWHFSVQFSSISFTLLISQSPFIAIKEQK